MRYYATLLCLALLTACATGTAPRESEYVTRVGVISGKEVVELEQARSESRVSTGVSASVSSGSGLSIGIGFLLSPLFNGSAEKVPVRYHLELSSGEALTVYHESDQFRVGDCVEVSTLPGDDKAPPLMKRVKDGC